MVTNRAQAELQSLIDVSDNQVNAGEALARLQETSRPVGVEPGEGDEAAFDTPKALATAVGASFILGPVGGLVLGVAQGILGKREKQTILDQLASERSAIGQADSIFADELDRLSMATDNPRDQEQLNSLAATKDAAVRMMMSASPGLQQQGAQLLQEFNSGLQAYTERQESQQIAAEADEARIQRELDDTQYTRYKDSITAFRSESQPYLDVMQATDTALQALGRGSPADLWAAGILVNKALDPTGIVRSEEAEAVGKLGNLWTKAGVILEKARSGETILPEQRRELSALLGTIRETVTKHQLARESRYSDQVADLELPTKYHNNFRLVQTVPAANAPAIPEGDGVATVLEKASEAKNSFMQWVHSLGDQNREPGLFQPGGFFDRDGKKRPTND